MADVSKGQERDYFRMRIARIYAVAGAIVCAVLFSFSFGMDLDPVTKVFDTGSVIGPVSYYVGLALAAAALALPFLIIPKRGPQVSSLPESNRYLAYYTLDPMIIKIIRICTAAVLIMQCAVRMFAVVSGTDEAGLNTALAVLMLMMTVPLALYFVPELTERIDPTRFKAHIILGCVGILWYFLNVLDRYFDKSISLASRFDTLCGICLLLGMLALLYEIKYRIDGVSVRARMATSGAFFILGFGMGAGYMFMLVSRGSAGFYSDALGVSLLVLSVYYGARIVFYTED